MTHLPTIISKYEERFEEYVDKYQLFTVDSFMDDNLPQYDQKEMVKSFLATFAHDLITEAFEATKLAYDNGINEQTGMLNYLQYNKGIVVGWNDAIMKVEARQQEFINEQQ